MKYLLRLLTILVLLYFIIPQTSIAADIRSGDTLLVEKQQKSLINPYFFGSTIVIRENVDGDLVTAGGNITTSGSITGSIMAAGGTITIDSPVQGSIRVAGGTITINGPVKGDVIVAGGSTNITNKASIDGDLILNGGQLQVEGPIKGKVVVGGGNVVLNSTVGENVEGTMGSLVLGSKAVINGDLSYTSSERAKIQEGAQVLGNHNFKKAEREKTEGLAALFAFGSFYKLITDILFTLAVVLLLRKHVQDVVTFIKQQPLKNGVTGFAVLILGLIAGIVLLIIFPLGITLLLIYALLLIFALAITKLFIGWFIMSWWQKRKRKTYALDWTAAVIGSLVTFLLLIIPIFGWFVFFILFLISLGALSHQKLFYLRNQKTKK